MKVSRYIACSLAALLAFSPVVGFAKGSKGSSNTTRSSSGSHAGHVQVKGYTKKDGTYVAPHHRSAPNGTKKDNWSTKGNVNPDSGKKGTENP